MFHEKKELIDWANNLKFPFTHYIVAQTNFRPFNRTNYSIANVRRELSKDLHHTFNKLSRTLNKDLKNCSLKRLSPYIPGRLVSIESLSPNLTKQHTTHFNILIGNINRTISTENLIGEFRNLWVSTKYGVEDCCIQKLDQRQNIYSYIFKEDTGTSKFYDTDFSSLDTNSSWIPENPAFVY